ncbi:lipoprotein insertase outer membrane protein LolB [Marinicellulosiphila megalodicopiae]|uniref:lipoprotein insertase outer membrane protein LolB n=1 Tax=Marinicellulosiphila megalodicopiae TaxID=2724896 RepID=UPI003BB11DF5
MKTKSNAHTYISTYISHLLMTIISLLLMVSCSTPQTKNNDFSLTDTVDINQEHYWKMEGRLSVRLSDGSAEKINMIWIQSGERLKLDFSGTFGLGTHIIRVNPDGSASIESSKVNESAESLPSLWEQFSPLPLPIEAFSYWIKGEAQPDTIITVKTATSEPKTTSFEQFGWQIIMSKYTDRKTYNMPNKIKLSDGTQSATVFIENWTFY